MLINSASTIHDHVHDTSIVYLIYGKAERKQLRFIILHKARDNVWKVKHEVMRCYLNVPKFHISSN